MEQANYRLSSLGDLLEAMIDGWEIVHLHYSDVCGIADGPDDRSAAFVELRRPDAGIQGLFIPDDERAFSHRAFLHLVRESPHIWKHRTADVIRARLVQLEAEAATRPEPASWGEVPDPADLPLDVSPATLRGVVALGHVESIDQITVALLSLERYRDFSRIRYLAHTADSAQRGSLTALDVLAVDDRGRRYRSASVGVARSGNTLEGVIVLAPVIPRDATALTITIGTIGANGPDGAVGPWVFPVALPTPPVG